MHHVGGHVGHVLGPFGPVGPVGHVLGPFGPVGPVVAMHMAPHGGKGHGGKGHGGKGHGGKGHGGKGHGGKGHVPAPPAPAPLAVKGHGGKGHGGKGHVPAPPAPAPLAVKGHGGKGHGKHHSGGGVLIFESYRKDGNRKLVIFVYRGRDGVYCCPGGKVGGHGDVANTAKDETREESKNMFNIELATLNGCSYIDIPAGHTLYRAYLLFVKGPQTPHGNHPIHSSVFDKNKKIIDLKPGVSPDWLETDDISRVYLEQFAKSYKDLACHNIAGNLDTYDVSGNPICLKGRDMMLIWEAINNGHIDPVNNTTTLSVHELRLDTNVKSKSKIFLDRTSSYMC